MPVVFVMLWCFCCGYWLVCFLVLDWLFYHCFMVFIHFIHKFCFIRAAWTAKSILKEPLEELYISYEWICFSWVWARQDSKAWRKLENYIQAFIGSFCESISFYWYFCIFILYRIIFHLENYNIKGKNVKRVI